MTKREQQVTRAESRTKWRGWGPRPPLGGRGTFKRDSVKKKKKRDSVILHRKGRRQFGGARVEGEEFLCECVSTLCGL